MSWEVLLHMAIALGTVGITITWDRLRQHSRTIDDLSRRTNYLATLTYFMMLRLYQRMDRMENSNDNEEVHDIEFQEDSEEEEEEEGDENENTTKTNDATVYTIHDESGIFTNTNGQVYYDTPNPAAWDIIGGWPERDSTTSHYTPVAIGGSNAFSTYTCRSSVDPDVPANDIDGTSSDSDDSDDVDNADDADNSDDPTVGIWVPGPGDSNW